MHTPTKIHTGSKNKSFIVLQVKVSRKVAISSCEKLDPYLLNGVNPE